MEWIIGITILSGGGFILLLFANVENIEDEEKEMYQENDWDEHSPENLDVDKKRFNDVNLDYQREDGK